MTKNSASENTHSSENNDPIVIYLIDSQVGFFDKGNLSCPNEQTRKLYETTLKSQLQKAITESKKSNRPIHIVATADMHPEDHNNFYSNLLGVENSYFFEIWKQSALNFVNSQFINVRPGERIKSDEFSSLSNQDLIDNLSRIAPFGILNLAFDENRPHLLQVKGENNIQKTIAVKFGDQIFKAEENEKSQIVVLNQKLNKEDLPKSYSAVSAWPSHCVHNHDVADENNEILYPRSINELVKNATGIDLNKELKTLAESLKNNSDSATLPPVSVLDKKSDKGCRLLVLGKGINRRMENYASTFTEGQGVNSEVVGKLLKFYLDSIGKDSAELTQTNMGIAHNYCVENTTKDTILLISSPLRVLHELRKTSSAEEIEKYTNQAAEIITEVINKRIEGGQKPEEARTNGISLGDIAKGLVLHPDNSIKQDALLKQFFSNSFATVDELKKTPDNSVVVSDEFNKSLIKIKIAIPQNSTITIGDSEQTNEASLRMKKCAEQFECAFTEPKTVPPANISTSHQDKQLKLDTTHQRD